MKHSVRRIYNQCPARGPQLQTFLQFGDTEQDPDGILSGLLLSFLQRAKGSLNPWTLRPELRLQTPTFHPTKPGYRLPKASPTTASRSQDMPQSSRWQLNSNHALIFYRVMLYYQWFNTLLSILRWRLLTLIRATNLPGMDPAAEVPALSPPAIHHPFQLTPRHQKSRISGKLWFLETKPNTTTLLEALQGEQGKRETGESASTARNPLLSGQLYRAAKSQPLSLQSIRKG